MEHVLLKRPVSAPRCNAVKLVLALTLAGLGAGWTVSCGASGMRETQEVSDSSSTESCSELIRGLTQDMDGQPLNLGAGLDAGRPLVLVFWQTWCGSCLSEAPALAAAARRLEGRVDFVGVIPGPDGIVDDDEVRAVSDRLGLPFAHVRDRDLALTRAFEVDGTPTLIALGSEAQVLWRGNHPPKDWFSVLSE